MKAILLKPDNTFEMIDNDADGTDHIRAAIGDGCEYFESGGYTRDKKHILYVDGDIKMRSPGFKINRVASILVGRDPDSYVYGIAGNVVIVKLGPNGEDLEPDFSLVETISNMCMWEKANASA